MASIDDILVIVGRKPAPKPDDPSQSKRFIESAEEVGADTDDAALERAFKKIVSQPSKETKDRS
jgi:hypothetical protein